MKIRIKGLRLLANTIGTDSNAITIRMPSPKKARNNHKTRLVATIIRISRRNRLNATIILTGEVKRPVERKPESPQKEEKPAWWDTPQRNYNPYAKSASSSAPKNVSARVQLEEAGKELARNSTAMQQSSPSDKGPVIVPKTETRPSVTNRNQTNQSNLNANVKIEVRDPSEIGPALKSLETAYPDAQINTPGTYGPSVG